MKLKYTHILLAFFLIVTLIKCKKEEGNFIDYVNDDYIATPYQLQIPIGFPEMPIPVDNPFTVEGVELGRHLFYEKSLSGDNTISCGSCHKPNAGYSDERQFSVGIDNLPGIRQSMPIMNIGWATNFFWDGRAMTLEEQIIEPVENPIEMHETWKNAIVKLKASSKYVQMFSKAFHNEKLDSLTAAKALAQFMRTMISGNSRFDQFNRREISLTPIEFSGLSSFQSLTGADCFHCHSGVLFTDFTMQNNGLNPVHTDVGYGETSGNPLDNGKFKVPSLRNLLFTAPYMHDGKFQNLDQVIEFYSTGLHASSPNISVNMEFASSGGVNLNLQEKAELKAFLLTLTDSNFINNPDFQDPNI